MGNTVARSHIRDADRGVAKATRVNTRRNSTGFSHDAALASIGSAHAASVLPDSLAASTNSLTPVLPPTPANPFWGSRPHAQPNHLHAKSNEMGFSSRDEALPAEFLEGSQPQVQDGEEQQRVQQRHNSAPRSSAHRSGYEENMRGIANRSSESRPVSDGHKCVDVSAEGRASLPAGIGEEPSPAQEKQLEVRARAVAPFGAPPNPARTAGRSAPPPRRRERHPSANISFSRNSSSQSVSARHASPEPPSRRVALEENGADQGRRSGKEGKKPEDRSVAGFNQRVTADMDPTIPGGTIRDCQTARTQTPPRVDKPPRASKVVSFNENVHVVTYPNEGSSTHSSANGEVSAQGRYLEGKQPKRRGRSVFRLLSKVSNPSGYSDPSFSGTVSVPANCFSPPHDTCCGMRLNTVSEVVYDELSPKGKARGSLMNRPHRAGRLLSFDSSKELYDESDIVVSFERSRAVNGRSPADVAGGSGFEDTIVDDFDYTERQGSDGDETLSLSDAHPSRDAIDEPEAIGDQLLSPGKEGGSATREASSFNITPLWQRLRRVDELDGIPPLGTSFMDRAAELGRSDSAAEAYLRDLSTMNPTGIKAETSTGTTGNRDKGDVTCPDQTGLATPARPAPTEASHEGGENMKASLHSRSANGPESLNAEDAFDSISNQQGHPGLATVMYTSPGPMDVGPDSDPFSIADPASDGDGAAALSATAPSSSRMTSGALSETTNQHERSQVQVRDVDYTFTELQHPDMRNASRCEQHPNESQNVPTASGKAEKVGTGSSDTTKGILRVRKSDDRKQETRNPRRIRAAEEKDIGRHAGFSVGTEKLDSSEPAIRGDREVLPGGAIGLDIDPTCLPLHDNFSVGPLSPPQIYSPLAGVYYGASASTSEANSPELRLRTGPGLADYPEYAMLKGQGTTDSAYGSEPDTPVLRGEHAWNEPFTDIDEGRQLGEEAPRHRANFEDRASRQPIPEVLLHDWSGSTPVEPSIEMVDSAPNSRSSTSILPVPVTQAVDEQQDLPHASVLLSTGLGTDTSQSTVPSTMLTEMTYGEGESRHMSESATAISKGTEKGSEGRLRKPEGRAMIHQQHVVETGGRTRDGQAPGSSYASTTNRFLDGRSVSGDLPRAERRLEVKNDPGQKRCFTYVPGLHPKDPRLEDFQVTVERKSFSDSGFNRGTGAVARGASFVERDPGSERRGEPSSDFRTLSRDIQQLDAPPRRLALPQRRRRVSSMEPGGNVSGRDEGNPFRGVMGRLVNGMHIAKRLVTPN